MTSFLPVLLAKLTLILGLGLIVSAMLRGSSPSLRHVVLFAVLALVVAGLVPRFYPNVTGATAAANKTAPMDPFPDQSNSRSMTISRGLIEVVPPLM